MEKLYVFDFEHSELDAPEPWIANSTEDFSKRSRENLNHLYREDVDFEIFHETEFDYDEHDIPDELNHRYLVIKTEGDHISYDGFDDRFDAEWDEFEFWVEQAQRMYTESYVFDEAELRHRYDELKRKDRLEHDDVLFTAIDHLLNQNGKRR